MEDVLISTRKENYFDFDVSKSTNTVVHFDEKGGNL
jgi:hypothetical protein